MNHFEFEEKCIIKELRNIAMSIIIAFFCGLCFYTLSDAIADYISAKAQMIKAQAEALGVQNKLKELEEERNS